MGSGTRLCILIAFVVCCTGTRMATGTRMRVLVLVCIVYAAAGFSKEYVPEARQNLQEKSNSDLVNQMAAFQRASLVYTAYASYFDRSNVNLPGFRKFFLVASDAALNNSRKVIDYINLRGGHQQFPILDMNAACKDMTVPKTMRTGNSDQTPKICNFILKRDPSAALKKKKKKSKNSFSFSFASKTMGGGDDQTQDQSSDTDWQRGLMGLSDALLMERSLNRQLLAMAQSAQERNDFHLRHTLDDSFLSQQTSNIKKLGDLITKLRQYIQQDYPLGEYLLDLELGN